MAESTVKTDSPENSFLEQKNSIVLLHGMFSDAFFRSLAGQELREVFVMEGRPSLAASKRSAGELLKIKIKPVLISDNMAGFCFYKNILKEIRIAFQDVKADGALCPIGSLILGVLGKKHGVPIYLFPSDVKSELMGKDEDLFSFEHKRVAPAGIKGYVPLMEWLPRKYITEIFT